MVLTNLFRELEETGFKKEVAKNLGFSLLEADRAAFQSLGIGNKRVQYPSLADYDNEGLEDNLDYVVNALEDNEK